MLLLQPTTRGNQGGLSLDLWMLSPHSTHARMSSGLMNANLYENSHSCYCLRRDPCFLATCANNVLWFSVVPSIFPVILLLSKEYNWREGVLAAREILLSSWVGTSQNISNLLLPARPRCPCFCMIYDSAALL